MKRILVVLIAALTLAAPTTALASWVDPGGDGYPRCLYRDPFTGQEYWVRC